MRRFRAVLAFVLLAFSVMSRAQDWGSMHYVRLGSERIVVLTKSGPIDIQREAAWDVLDPKQKNLFESWVKRAGLPKDPGQFVTDLPPGKEIPLAAEIGVGTPLADREWLELKFKSDNPKIVGLVKQSGWSVDADSRKVLADFCSKLHTQQSALLVALCGQSSWAKFIDKGSSEQGFVALVGPAKLAVWSHPKVVEPPAELVSDLKSDPVLNEEKPREFPWAISTGVLGLLCVAGGISFAVRSIRSKASEPAFKVGEHERELILEIREGARKNPPPLNANYSVEEYAVGLALDRYRGYEPLVSERDAALAEAQALRNYQQYQQRYEEFEARYNQATEALKRRESDLASEQNSHRASKQKLQQAEERVAALVKEGEFLKRELATAEDFVIEANAWTKSVTERLNAQAAKIHHE